ILIPDYKYQPRRRNQGSLKFENPDSPKHSEPDEIKKFCYDDYNVTLTSEAKAYINKLMTHQYCNLPNSWSESLKFYNKLGTFITQWISSSSWQKGSMSIEDYSHHKVSPIIQFILYGVDGIEVKFGEQCLGKIYQARKVEFLIWKISIESHYDQNKNFLDASLRSSWDSLIKHATLDMFQDFKTLAIHFYNDNMDMYVLEGDVSLLIASIDLRSGPNTSMWELCEKLLALNKLIVHNITLIDNIFG